MIAGIAFRQHGVLSFAQLRSAGVSKDSVAKAVAAGRLHRLHRGVYAVGHRALSNEGRWMAAVLACGTGAVLSHRSAAELWRLLDPRPGPIHVTIPTDAGRKQRRGLKLHRSPFPPDAATTRRSGIAVTTPARTLRDLARAEPAHAVRRATRQAEYLGLALGNIRTDGTRSELEAAFLALCRRHRLPLPEVNVRVGPYTVDFLWREQRLVVEVDGYAAHRGRQAFEDDRARDLCLHSDGLRVRRFSHLQVAREARDVVAAIRAELGR